MPEWGDSGGVRTCAPAESGWDVRRSGASFSEVAVGGGWESQPDIEQTVERGPSVAAAVPAEHEPVKVALDMRPPQAVVHAQSPALEVGEDPVNPHQNLVSFPVANHPFLQRIVGQASVTAPAIGDHPRIRRDRPSDESAKRPGSVVLNRLKPNAARLAALRQFHRSGHEDTPRSTAQEAPVRVDHRPTQLMEKQPGALVAANAQLRLKLERRDAVGMRGQEMRGQEPRPERQVAAVHHCTRRHRGLASAACALAEETLPLQLPALRAAAGRAAEASAPAQPGQMAGAGIVVWEELLELLAGYRAVVFPVAGHR